MNDLHTIAASCQAIEHGETVPFAQQMVVLSKQEHIQLLWDAHFFETLHQRALSREADLKKQLSFEKAKVRDLTQRLYGKKSEKTTKRDEGQEIDSPAPRPRGQQVGSRGHGRTPRPHLPVVEEILDLSEAEKYCQDCGRRHFLLPGTDDSEIVEVEVRAYSRKIKRRKYARCHCRGKRGMLTAPATPRLLNRSPIGTSVWVEILLDKFLYAQSTNRLCNSFKQLGYPLSQGSITDGLRRLMPLFQPLVEAMLDKQMTEHQFHADETGWKVFERIADKQNYRWYLWLIQSPSVAFYIMAPGRGANVPTAHFSGLDESLTEVILICDRYSAYKKLVKDIPMILLAFCWAHVRRDFIDAARGWPDLKDWMFNWVEDIRELYHLNKLRLCHFDEQQAIKKQSPAFKRCHRLLRKKLAAMRKQRDTDLQQEDLHEVQRSVLSSLKNHWSGLTLFADQPQIAMDNNQAERGLRNPVTGRKRYYGSGRVWSAELAAMMFTVFETLRLWHINQRHWLSCYLHACAENGGESPVDLKPFLPWQMTAKQLMAFSLPPPIAQVAGFKGSG